MRYLTKLRLGFRIFNELKFKRNFNSLTPLCTCGIGIEDNEHFLLQYPPFHLMHRNLLCQLSDISSLTIDIDNKPSCDLLLFGDPQLNVVSNRRVLEATISFIKNTKNFSSSI